MPKCPYSTPHSILRKDGSRISVEYPCGCCAICAKNAQMQIYPRIREDILTFNHSIFFTLTVRDEFLTPTVDYKTGEVILNGPRLKSMIQSELKVIDTRIRRKYKTNKPQYHYYFCYEYGPNTRRAHLHGIINHNYDNNDFLDLSTRWKNRYGFTVAKILQTSHKDSSSKVAHYISKYTSKGMLDSFYPLVRRGLLVKPWRIYSQGFGARYLDRMRDYHTATDIKRRGFHNDLLYIETRADTILNRLCYVDGSACYPLPKYYIDKMFNGRKVRLERFDINGKNIPRYIQYKTDSLPRLLELAIRRKHLHLYLTTMGEMASRLKTRNIDEIFAFSEKNRLLRETESEREISTKLASFYFKNKIKFKQL